MLTTGQSLALESLRNHSWRQISNLNHFPKERTVTHCCEILSDGNPITIFPKLSAVYWNSPKKSQPQIAQALKNLINQLPPKSWPQIDQELRNELSALQYQVTNIGLDHSSPTIDSSLRILIGLCHPNGHIREGTIKSISSADSKFIIQLLLLRTNDWVAPVASAAKMKASQLLSANSAEHLESLLETFSIVRRSTRHQAQKSLNTIIDLIKKDQDWANNLSLILNGKVSGSAKNAASKFLLLHLNELNEQQLLRFLKTGSPKEIIQLLKVSHSLCSAKQTLILDTLESNSSVPVQRFLLRLLGTTDRRDKTPVLLKALCNPSRTSRQIARFYLKQWTDIDFKQHYLEALDKKSTIRKHRATFLGLHEVSPSAAHELALLPIGTAEAPLLNTYIMGLDLQSGDIPESQMISWISSPILSTCQTILKIMIEQKVLLPIRDLKNLIANTSLPDHSRIAAAKIGFHKERWTSIQYLIESTSLPDKTLNTTLNQLILQWYDKRSSSAINPNREQLEQIQNTFTTHRSFLSEENLRNFDHLLKILNHGIQKHTNGSY